MECQHEWVYVDKKTNDNDQHIHVMETVYVFLCTKCGEVKNFNVKKS
jgi:predicted RNA-binding Zn-ribbon protein involved in translation (DUF1610 family)